MLGLATGCSVTRNLPEGEVLYTGIRRIEVLDSATTSPNYKHALDEINAALEYAPNNALFGSSSLRSPLPVGLWAYNAFVGKKSKFKRWMFRRFAARPVLLSTVNPELRAAVAHNVQRENGYFQGTVSADILPDKKNPRKAKVSYRIQMNRPYTYDSIRYLHTRSAADSLIALHEGESLLRKGAAFSVSNLEAERSRISSLLRANGFYYYRPEYLVYRADTFLTPGKVWLRVMRKPGLPQSALTPFRIGHVDFRLNGYHEEKPTDSIQYKNLTIHYEGKLRMRPSVLYRRLMLRPGDLYSETREQQTQTALSRLGVFRYAEMQFRPDTARDKGLLNLSINTLYDLPLSSELAVNLTDKSNDLRGPGAVFSLTRQNLFGGGESLKAEAKGSYEWQTNKARAGLNSYEAGLSATLNIPAVLLPGFSQRGLAYPSSTDISLSADLLNRARFFRMTSFNAALSYEFHPNAVHSHVITPLKLTYNKLTHRTAEFDSIAKVNPSLALSLSNQFIPAFGYTYTYDDSSRPTDNHIWWQGSFTEAGNLLSAAYALAGQHWNRRNKQLFGNPYAQFVKLTGEFRYNYRLDKNNRLAARLMAGAIVSYGNSNIAPFSEQFYVGGANSIRAFNIRSIGPGRFIPVNPHLNPYAYIDQTGDLKIEGNLEYRFRIIGNLHGATFLDCGNIWLLRKDPNRPGGTFMLKHFLNDLALGTGAGLRYDLDFLVIRFDVGIGLHLPYETGRSGYYNIPRFGDALAFHLAVGYPF
jgi:outer membrane protein assembly factor BamA